MVYYITKVLVRNVIYFWISFMLWNCEKNSFGKKVWFFDWFKKNIWVGPAYKGRSVERIQTIFILALSIEWLVLLLD